jgi:succinate dehydrogenase / fumarate reductase cytochrome b subunit
MNAVLALYQSTVGKKVAMALSGLVYVGWVLFHMVGNLQFHLGAEALNEYAHKLQSMPPLVWSGRSMLLAALIVHVVSAVLLIRHNGVARPGGYKGGQRYFATTPAARSMRWGGISLLLFIGWHLLDFTIGAFGPLHALLGPANFYQYANLGFLRGEVYHNMLASFGNPVSLVVYIAATVALSLHLYHGAWSTVQTLGFEAANTKKVWRSLAAFVAGVVLVGNLSFPVAGFLGVALGFSEGQPLTGHGVYYGVEIPPGAPTIPPRPAH